MSSEDIKAFKVLSICQSYGVTVEEYIDLFKIYNDEILIENIIIRCYKKGFKIKDYVKIYQMYSEHASGH